MRMKGVKAPRECKRITIFIILGLAAYIAFVVNLIGGTWCIFDPHLAQRAARPDSTIKPAFVTTLLDDGTCEATEVLLFSLSNTGTTVPRIVLAPRQRLSFDCKQAIHDLGGEIREVDEISVLKTASAKEFNKHLRFTKLLAWSLIEFDRVVLIDSDMVVLRNIDHLFGYPELSAVEDSGAPGLFNSGLMVIRPDMNILSGMLGALPESATYNGGDQGFLNLYFKAEWTSNPALRLPVTYNMFPRLKHYASWGLYRRDIHILHFTAEVKPWTFYYRHHPNWLREFDPELTWIWVEHKIKKDAKLQLQGHPRPIAVPPNDHAKNCKAWSNLQSRRLNTQKFTLMINTFDDVQAVRLLIGHYSPAPSLAEIHIVWHDPDQSPPADIHLPRTSHNNTTIHVPVHVHHQTSNTLNNRWGRPLHDFSTQLVLTIDDDTLVEDVSDVEFAFKIARQHPWRLVGMYPRAHFRNGNASLEYMVASKKDKDGFRRYSMVLTKFMFLDARYFFMYTCLLPHELKTYITKTLNCEDLAMNWMVSGLAGHAPLAVIPKSRLLDMGTLLGDNLQRISLQKGHLQSRSQCLNAFESMLGPCPLVYADYVLEHFIKVPFVKVSKSEYLEGLINVESNHA